MNRLKVNNIEKHFDGVTALAGANFSIDASEVCGLLGANGSGKTTLSRIIAGLYKADGGEIIFEGHCVAPENSIQARRMGIAMAHQNLSLVSEMTVWENICLGNEKMKGVLIDDVKCVEEAKNVLKLFELTGFENRLAKSLSPAQKQLVEICKAVSLMPKLLILDEPTAPLEFAQVNMLFEVIRQLKRNGMAIVFISHRIWEVTQICDKIIVLRNGETVSAINIKDINEKDQNKIILNAITGKEVKESIARKVRVQRDESILRLNNLNLKDVLHNITFDVTAGEIVGISGLQGMGQEELLLVLSGYMQPTGGEIYYKKKLTKWHSARQAISTGVVLVPGDRQREGLFLEHKVLDNLMFPEFSKKRSPFFVNNKKLRKVSASLIDRLSLIPRDYEIKANNLSGGNQQKVVVGKWINQTPDVLLMSDPAKGIDVEARFELYEICKSFSDEGKSVIIYASDNHELLDICDKVLVMFEGKIVQIVDKQDLCEERLMEAALHMHAERGE
ncbi:MAG: sugar ABC transporter ATP-binding protein [Treponema sp.]|nr:sugar ABC transporter ATP-binding protein [Treponema sp.]